jgi:hypothetical protein
MARSPNERRFHLRKAIDEMLDRANLEAGSAVITWDIYDRLRGLAKLTDDHPEAVIHEILDCGIRLQEDGMELDFDQINRIADAAGVERRLSEAPSPVSP